MMTSKQREAAPPPVVGVMRTIRSMGLLGVLVALAAVLFAPSAGAVGTYEGWRFSGRVCVQDNGWNFWPAAQAGAAWAQAANVDLVVWDSCASQPRSQTVILRTYQSTENACAKTGSADGSDADKNGDYTWTYVDGRWTWVPNLMTLWLNTHPDREAVCFSSAEQRAHVISHELGHALGLGHPEPADATVMGSWAKQWPTATDLVRAEWLYRKVAKR